MSSSSMSAQILNLATKYTLYTGCVTFLFAIIGNTINILVFTQLKLFRDNRSAFYLTVESISNIIYQFNYITIIILTSIYGDDATGRFSFWCKFRYMWSLTTALTAYYMTCCAAADQFLSTNYRFNLRQMCTLKFVRYFTFTMICIWIIHSIVFGWFFDIQPSVGCVISNPIYLQYATYFLYLVLIGLLPIVMSAIFSLLAFRNVRRIVRRQLPIVRRRLDRQMTAMVLIRVVFFVCFALPYSIFRTYVVNVPVSRGQPMEFATRQLIQAVFLSSVVLNYTVSFYVFMISSSRFRRQVKLFLDKKCWKRLKHWCCLKNNQVGPENPESDNGNMDLEENA